MLGQLPEYLYFCLGLYLGEVRRVLKPQTKESSLFGGNGLEIISLIAYPLAGVLPYFTLQFLETFQVGFNCLFQNKQHASQGKRDEEILAGLTLLLVIAGLFTIEMLLFRHVHKINYVPFQYRFCEMGDIIHFVDHLLMEFMKSHVYTRLLPKKRKNIR